MKLPVMLSVKGVQHYQEQDPETIELVTEGILEDTASGWTLTYEESELTGLAGVTTTFQVEPACVTLSRTGPLSSTMVFREGEIHESLYKMEFGTLLLTVCASKVEWNLGPNGGTIDLTYAIEIEQSAAGVIDYHLTVQPIQK